jgi:hypothetical protein
MRALISRSRLLHVLRWLVAVSASAVWVPLLLNADFLALAEPGFDFGKVIPDVTDGHGSHVDMLCPHPGFVEDAKSR